MSVETITDNPPNKGDVGPAETGDYSSFLINCWKEDATRPEIYQRKGSAVPDWMHRLEPDLQDKDHKR